MLLNYNRTVAYICPDCSGINHKNIQIFNFSGNKKCELYCQYECDEKCVTISQKKDKYKIDVVCPICRTTHSFSMKSSTFWHSKFTSFKCPDSGIDIYFHGEAEMVDETLKKQEEFFSTLINENGDLFGTEILLAEILKYIQLLASEGAIGCACGSVDIQMEVCEDSITLQCMDCGAKKVIFPDEDSLTALINENEIYLGEDDDDE